MTEHVDPDLDGGKAAERVLVARPVGRIVGFVTRGPASEQTRPHHPPTLARGVIVEAFREQLSMGFPPRLHVNRGQSLSVIQVRPRGLCSLCHCVGVATTYLQQSHLAVVVLSVSAVAFAVGEFLQTLRRRRGSRHVDLVGEVVFRVLFFGGILMLPAGASLAPGAVVPGGVVPFVLGAAVCWLGLALRWWSFLTLGRYFTVVLKVSADQVVVERGPYRFLRHPSYTGLLMALLGFGLILGNWAGLLASFVLILAAVIYRIRIEERTLFQALGDPYRRFAANRARLVPFVW